MDKYHGQFPEEFTAALAEFDIARERAREHSVRMWSVYIVDIDTPNDGFNYSYAFTSEEDILHYKDEFIQDESVIPTLIVEEIWYADGTKNTGFGQGVPGDFSDGVNPYWIPVTVKEDPRVVTAHIPRPDMWIEDSSVIRVEFLEA